MGGGQSLLLSPLPPQLPPQPLPFPQCSLSSALTFRPLPSTLSLSLIPSPINENTSLGEDYFSLTLSTTEVNTIHTVQGFSLKYSNKQKMRHRAQIKLILQNVNNY